MSSIASVTRRRAAVVAATSTAAMLATFASVLALGHVVRVGDGLVVLGVFLTLSLSRQDQRGPWSARAVRLLTLIAVAFAARYVAETLLHHPTIGDALLVVGLSVPIAIRRFGPWWSRLGTLISLPFIAVITTPAIGPPGAHDGWWAPVVAVIAYAWVSLAQEVAHLLGAPVHRPAASHGPAHTRRPSRMRPSPPTRMALQMAAALTLAFLVGRTVFGHHWAWVVITAFVVSAGNRGRGDVVHKGVLRIGGALVGTGVATLVGGVAAPGSHGTIVAILAVLAVATALRVWSYAWWAAGMTGALALLYGYAGEGGAGVLGERLLGILAGGAIAVAVAWWVLPIPTAAVLRGRTAAVLAALQDTLGALRDPEADRDLPFGDLEDALRQLDGHLPTARAHRRAYRLAPAARRGESPADALETLAGLRPTADRLLAGTFTGAGRRQALGVAARELGEIRRSLRDTQDVAALGPALAALADRLDRLADQGLEPPL